MQMKPKNCLQVVISNVDMIDIVLDQKEQGYGISKEFGKSMIVVACLSLLL